MKQLLTLIFALFLVGTSMAQAPEFINYQGVARDANGEPLANQTIGVGIIITETAPPNTVYEEDHLAVTTDANGLFSIKIGAGTVPAGSPALSTVDWSNDMHRLVVYMNPSGGPSIYVSGYYVGVQDLVSVPYALHAKTAESLANGSGGEWTTNGNDISNSNAGNVGIGTTTPETKLHLNGGSFWLGGTHSGGLGTGAGAGIRMFNEVGRTSIFSYDYANSTAQNLVLQQPGGNVGIGTSTPEVKLQISGGTDASLTAGDGVFQLGNSGSTNLLFDDNEIMARNAGVANTLHIQADGGDMTLHNNNAVDTKVIFKEDGSVGIGTTSPSAKLDVKGTAILEQVDRSFFIPSWAPVNQRVFAGVFDGRGVNSPVIRYAGLNGNFIDEGIDNDGDYILNTNGTTRFTVQQNGNVGIGTISPTTKLNIQGGSDASLSAGSGYLQTGAETSTNMVMDNNEIQVRNNGAASAMFLQAEGGDFRIGNLAAPRMIVLDNGNVGIGTSSPSSQLEVYGDSKNIEISNTAETDAGIIFNDAQGTTTQFAEIKFNSSSNDLVITQDGTAAITIEPNGEVGIGTSNPQSALSVNGTITSKEIEVTLSGFPDYVFEDDYYLMSLEEVEAYIEEHGHLPNVPSAEVIEEEGLGLGELNKILMEKVEELTLHLIEKDKDVEELQAQMQLLLERMNANIGN